ncbi:unnamed protein product [Dovyalis caffra]|uniref:PH domain-containing protein n=1 Tax=Dovyalis caffra TaxID=77055 RepID=A0AAV1SAG2_9ROSI|nr:unnamed protein product [Dovyalis caffra]
MSNNIEWKDPNPLLEGVYALNAYTSRHKEQESWITTIETSLASERYNPHIAHQSPGAKQNCYTSLLIRITLSRNFKDPVPWVPIYAINFFDMDP